jgi:hypothetical protein
VGLAAAAATFSAGLVGAALSDLAIEADGDLPGLLADGDRRALAFTQLPAYRIDALWPGRTASLSKRSISPWLAAPSQVTISRLRKAGDSTAIAASRNSRWSATVLLNAISDAPNSPGLVLTAQL